MENMDKNLTNQTEEIKADISKEEAAKKVQARKERSKRWKADKKALRDRKKEELKNAPMVIRLWRLYLKVPTILALILIFFIAVFSEDVISYIDEYQYNKEEERWNNRFAEVEDKSLLYDLSPLDEEGAKRIAALPEYDENDTWTICLYFVGSNLEDLGENDLSDLTVELTHDIKEENTKLRQERMINRRKNFREELMLNGLDCPEYLYKIYKPIASSTPVTNDVIVATEEGSASADINEVIAGLTSDKIKVVIQTGGATRWSNALINPNKTQRFLCTNESFKEIENLPLQDSCDPDTITEFLKYCNDNYKSDHMAVILWDHGNGYSGFGLDRLYNTNMSLEQIEEAFSNAVEKNPGNPAYDFVGFDACIMGTIEVTHLFNGYAKYMAVSEEMEPGDGWDYKALFSRMGDNPKMNAASVCQAIADTYTDSYMTENINVSDFAGTEVVTFSVIDVAAAEKLYDAYCELNKTMLIDVLNDPKNLTNIARSAKKAPAFAGSFYDIYNEIDLGVYMDYLSDFYPDECKAVRDGIKEAVLYHRENDYLADSTGIAAFFPAYMNNDGGLGNALLYANEVCEDEATAALFYYKIAGCLNERFVDYAKSIGCENYKKINTRVFRNFDECEIVMDEDIAFHIALDSRLEDMIADSKLELACYDVESGTLKYLGRDNCSELDGEGNIMSDFDGRWFAFGNQMLEADIITSNISGYSYRSRILHNGEPSYLYFSYNPETDELLLNGVSPMPDEYSISNDYSILKNSVELQLGDKITPIYTATDLNSNQDYEDYGEEFKYKKNTKLNLKSLEDGTYLQSIIISDTRGDNYYSGIVSFEVSGGKYSNAQVSTEFVGIDD